jgi:hypothetical protein
VSQPTQTRNLPDANDFLFAGGIPSAKFDTIGTTVIGTIKNPPTTQQQTDFDTGQPKFWDDGRPMLQVVVDIQTDQRDPDIEDDDGVRRLYVRGKHLTNAVRDAVRRAGAKRLEVGATLQVTFSGEDEPKRRGANGAKQYTAVYTPPADAVLGAGDTTEPAPATSPATAGGLTREAFPHLTPEQLAGVQAAGLSADQVRQMFPSPAA